MSFRSETGTSSANTVVFPNLRDPSELRSEFNGKVVRYLVADGEKVGKDEPYVELEAMKMIMSLRADEAGKVTQSLSHGAAERLRHQPEHVIGGREQLGAGFVLDGPRRQ